jgi:hypothetical protein
MDEIVKQALAKWPNVPHCYGWLALDARGNWRMRDERAQAQNLRGDIITHPALLAFINRNYQSDDQGNWFFQNGPQRVYVTHETTPYIARTSPEHGLILHTGEPLAEIDTVSMTCDGNFIFSNGTITAQLDDRDLAQMLELLLIDSQPVSDENLVNYLEIPTEGETLTLNHSVLGRLPVYLQRS